MSNANAKPLISICIPTYNRAEKVFNLVNEILKYDGIDIEVAVLDNHSTDNTKDLLMSIHDPRLAFFVNETNLGGIYNCVKAMTKGQGEFVLYCLDKDYINHPYIKRLIEIIKANETIAAGYCELNLSLEKESVKYQNEYDSFRHAAYLSKHPSGYLFKNEYLQTIQIEKWFANKQNVGAFPFEFIFAELCLRGSTMVINIPLCYTEKPEDAANVKSFTHSASTGIFFFPDERYKTFERYVYHILSLNRTKKIQFMLVKKVFIQEIMNATVLYKSFCSNKEICQHYNLSTKHISLRKIIGIYFGFCKKYISNCQYTNSFLRLLNCILYSLIIIINITAQKVFAVFRKYK